LLKRRRRFLTPEEVQRKQKIRKIILNLLYPIVIAFISFFIFMALKV
jgi:hypothetical protein